MLQQKTLKNTALVQRQVEDKGGEIFRIKEVPDQIPEVTPNLESYINTIKCGGQPLPEPTRTFFGPRVGYDFSQVRVHTGAQAAESAQTINARAYTVGQNVVFGAGQYVPGTTEGQRLLAHELTHVVQQNGDQVTTSRGNSHSERMLASGSRAAAGIVQREVVRNNVVDYTYIPDGRLPHGIVVDLNFPHEASQRMISLDLIIALRRWVMTQERDRSPGLVNALSFQRQLRRYLDGYRILQRPSIRGEWEYRIYIQLNRNLDPGPGNRVDSIAIDTRRHPPIPQPERSEGPSETEREGWIDRAIADPGIRSSVRRMLVLYKREQLDGKYFTSRQVDQRVRVAGLTYSDLNNVASDACTGIAELREHSINYWRFKAGVLEIRTNVLGGLNRIDFHDGEGQPIETSADTARTIHCWMWQRQEGQNNVYAILEPTPCDSYARRRRTC